MHLKVFFIFFNINLWKFGDFFMMNQINIKRLFSAIFWIFKADDAFKTFIIIFFKYQ